jgi:RNA polymerase sigma-70 factor, ECF subfamily
MLIFLNNIDCEEIRNQLEELYCLYKKDLWFIANDILDDVYEAEDVVQTAFIKVSGYLKKDGDIKGGKTRCLIVIIVRNLSFNVYNQRKRRPTVNIEELEDVLESLDDQNPEPRMIRLQDSDRIAGQLARIKPEYADILSLKYEYEYSNKEIANMFDIDEINVRVRLNRAKKALQNMFGGDLCE